MRALVRYDSGQIDDDGREVSVTPFLVEFDAEPEQDAIEAIAETGNVQFDWILISLSR